MNQETKDGIWLVWYGCKDKEGKMKDHLVWSRSLEGARRIARECIKKIGDNHFIRIFNQFEAYKNENNK